jgi:hypothetical protein
MKCFCWCYPNTNLVKFILIWTLKDKEVLNWAIRERNTKFPEEVVEWIIEIPEDIYTIFQEKDSKIYYCNKEKFYCNNIQPYYVST